MLLWQIGAIESARIGGEAQQQTRPPTIVATAEHKTTTPAQPDVRPTSSLFLPPPSQQHIASSDHHSGEEAARFGYQRLRKISPKNHGSVYLKQPPRRMVRGYPCSQVALPLNRKFVVSASSSRVSLPVNRQPCSTADGGRTRPLISRSMTVHSKRNCFASSMSYLPSPTMRVL